MTDPTEDAASLEQGASGRSRRLLTSLRSLTELALALALVLVGASAVSDTWYVQTDGGFEDRKWAILALASIALAVGGGACSLIARRWYWTWGALALAAAAALIVQIGY